MLTIDLPLEPYAQERPRFARAGKFVKTYDGAKSKAWKAAARIYMKAAMRGLKMPVYSKGVPVGVRLRFYFPLPKASHRKRTQPGEQWHIGRMDFDNLTKCVCDAAKGLLWDDDRQVVYARIEKIRVAQGGRPACVIIEAWEAEAR